MKREYKVHIKREGRWWMVHIPELDGLTQARRLGESALMAREWIAVSTDTPIGDISVRVEGVEVPGLGDVAARATAIVDARMAAEAAQRDAIDFARELTKAGVPVRDTAALLQVSPQRISQLSNT